jgi:hypothetical protein
MYIPRVDSVEYTRYRCGMTHRTENKIKEIQPSEFPKRGGRFRISEHATTRFIERVAPRVPDSNAVKIFQSLVCNGRSRGTPRWWMKNRVTKTPGTRYVYWSDLPDVCALVRNGTVVTVLTKSMFLKRRTTSEEPERSELRRRNQGEKRVPRPVFRLVKGEVA